MGISFIAFFMKSMGKIINCILEGFKWTVEWTGRIRNVIMKFNGTEYKVTRNNGIHGKVISNRLYYNFLKLNLFIGGLKVLFITGKYR